ncbi:MAG: HD domain-containing protein [Elusimicrobia bacterium]|nr:HD domain-containing protein [Elusimicrobiota bacterium]
MENKDFDALEQRVYELSMLLEINKIIISTLDLDKLLNLIMNLASKVVHSEASSLMLMDEDSQELYFDVALGEKGEQVKQIRIKTGEGIAGHVAQTGLPLIVNDVSKDSRFAAKFDDSTQFKTKSILCVPLKVKNKIIGVMEAINKDGSFDMDSQYILEVFASQAAVAIDNAQLFKKLRNAYLGAINALTEAINAKDHYTAGHVDRVGEYALSIAHTMNLNEESIEVIKQAALLHDVGKIGIPEAVLNKPGKLTDEEFALMKSHSTMSATIVQPIGLSPKILEAIKHHHERVDGHGYPDGLKGDTLTLEAKILCVADTYDAMITDRPYRQGLSKDIAIAELKKCSGTQFDASVVEAFLKVLSG